jgi:hypothetical protein
MILATAFTCPIVTTVKSSELVAPDHDVTRAVSAGLGSPAGSRDDISAQARRAMYFNCP